MIFSFYLSDKITHLAIFKNPIMKTIENKSESLAVMSINATIKDNTIIPGINGKKIDKEASFFKMKDFGAFNETFFVYESIKPDISLEDNKDKVIIQGNNKLRQVSILIDDNEELKSYFKNLNLNITILAKMDTVYSNYSIFEYINAEKEINDFNDLESILKKNKFNKKICILEHSNIEKCKEKEYYLVKPNIVVTNSNIIETKNNISNGSIIYIDKNVNINNIKLILNKIKYLDLKIVYLSKLIEE